jgi:hypothetical protein
MKRWEYRTLLGNFFRDPRFTLALNKYGREGWEAYAVVKEQGTNEAAVLFKRRLKKARRG